MSESELLELGLTPPNELYIKIRFRGATLTATFDILNHDLGDSKPYSDVVMISIRGEITSTSVVREGATRNRLDVNNLKEAKLFVYIMLCTLYCVLLITAHL